MPAPLAIAYAAITMAQIAGEIKKGIKDTLPKLEEEISVTVYGGPTAARMDLYRLAMSIVWGKIQRRDFLRILLPAGFLKLEYNLEQNYVNVTCRIVTTYTAALVGLLRTARRYEIFQGPVEVTNGGEWAFTSVLPGLPGSPGMDIKNGFENRTLITSQPFYRDAANIIRATKSPTPPGDKLSRGYATLARSPVTQALDPNNWNNTPDYLLWAALSEPCGASNTYQPVVAYPPTKPNPIPSPGNTPSNPPPTGGPATNPMPEPVAPPVIPNPPPQQSTSVPPIVPPPNLQQNQPQQQ